MPNMRQYIGARYVTKIYENSLDPSTADWESGVYYEPLTLVTYNNSSYISKKDVPPGVGDPSANPDYWTVTGFYNGQIAALDSRLQIVEGDTTQLLSDVATLQDDVAELQGNDIIFIGDSYGLDSAVGGNSWATNLSGVYPTATFLIQGGTGFASDYYMSDNFRTMLTAHVNTLTAEQKLAVKHVIVAGGANDGNLIFDGTITAAQLGTRIQQFCSYVASNLPNAIVKCAFIGWYRKYARHAAYLQARDRYARHYAPNYTYYAGPENVMKPNHHIENVTFIHPTVNASIYLASAISSMVDGGEYKFGLSAEPSTTAVTGVTVNHILKIYSYFDGDTASVEILGDYYNNSFWQLVYASGHTTTQGKVDSLLTLDKVPVGGANPAVSFANVEVFNDGGTSLGFIPVSIGIQDNELFIKYHIYNTMQIRTVLIPWTYISMNLRDS